MLNEIVAKSAYHDSEMLQRNVGRMDAIVRNNRMRILENWRNLRRRRETRLRSVPGVADCRYNALYSLVNFGFLSRNIPCNDFAVGTTCRLEKKLILW